MSAPTTPPGWYPMPDGSNRYWNGSEWLDLPDPTGGRPKRRGWIPWVIAGSVALFLVIAGVGGFAVVSEVQRQQEATAAEEALAQEQAQAQAQAEEEAQQQAQAEAAEAAAATAERDRRDSMVVQVEASVLEMAQGHATEGLLDAAPFEVSCSPVGGSLDDLTALTTTFDCFAATEDLGDGTMRGFHYNALVNWDSGEYSYGFGAP